MVKNGQQRSTTVNNGQCGQKRSKTVKNSKNVRQGAKNVQHGAKICGMEQKMFGMIPKLCKSVPLRICNGRKLGDFLGSYTCYKKHGQSTVDFCLISPSIYNIVSTFVINELLPDLSDHCSVTIHLQTKYFSQLCKNEHFDLSPKPKRLKWDSNISTRFENYIQSESSSQFLSDFLKRRLDDYFSLNKAMTDLSDFLATSAEKAYCQIDDGLPSRI